MIEADCISYDEALRVPATSSISEGLSVPIPTLPVPASDRIRSWLRPGASFKSVPVGVDITLDMISSLPAMIFLEASDKSTILPDSEVKVKSP